MQQPISSFTHHARWILIAATTFTAPVHAQSTTPSTSASATGAGGNVVWTGSYAQSCTDIDVDKHGRLSATCTRTNGKSNRTNLTDKECPNHRAANMDGKLVCESQATAGSGRDAGSSGNVGNGDSGRWQGSFRQSCRDFSVNEDGTLSATCRTKSGTWRESSLARVNCTDNRAANDDGHLVCESQRVGMNKWEGSFERTCRDIYMDKAGTLTATCQTTNGEWNRSWLSAKNCSSYMAANRNGQLACERDGRIGSNNRWDGSFQQSCRDISVSDNGTLTASCQTKTGTWQRSMLAAANCTDNRAKNEDGRLACETQRVGENRWSGSFKQTCRDVYMDADGTLTATCQSKSGAWVPARLPAKGCSGYAAANNDGKLVCEQQTARRQ